MKFSNSLRPFAILLTVTLLTGAREPAAAQPAPSSTQRSFASPEEAVQAMQAAVESKDKAAVRQIFGPEIDQLQTGDAVQDAQNMQRFAAALSQGCHPVKDSDDKITVEIGTNNWPMPIPLVKADGQWSFNTAAGKEEILNRHIGKDELHALGVCQAFVTAERAYASANGGTYARKFKSSPGKKDGLYWPAGDNEPASPFGPLVAEAHLEGYGPNNSAGPHPFHGYYFRILTRQGKAAPGGKMNYVRDGDLRDGFALVAYPEHWDQSGIMTFIVNQDGKIYERNLAEKTAQIGGKMKAYNPDEGWTLVQDQGVAGAVLEK